MTKVTVVSGFSPAGYKEYGKKFLESFDKYWPQEVDLQVYTEEFMTGVPRKGLRSLWNCEGADVFISRWKGHRPYNGFPPNPRFKPKEIARGYSFRYDAVKFCKQCFIPEKASKELPDGDIMVWLDADVITFRAPPKDLVESLFPIGADLIYLGRRESHSEIGFWAV